MKHYVYKITDPKTGQYYIGVRSCNCKIEDDDYMGSMISWTPEDDSRLIKEIIKGDFKTREEANIYESHLIKKVWKDELNENYCIQSPKMTFLHHQHSKEVKDSISKSVSKLQSGQLNTMYGKRHSNESKRRMRENHGSKCIICQYDTNDSFIKEWDSILEAARYYNGTDSNIIRCLKGKGKTAYGFKWKYKQNPAYGD